MPYHRAYILTCPNVKCTQQGFEMCILWAQGSLEATECRDSIIRPEISWSCRKWHRCQKMPVCRKRGVRHRMMLRFFIKFQLSKAVPGQPTRYSFKVENALVVVKLIFRQGGYE